MSVMEALKRGIGPYVLHPSFVQLFKLDCSCRIDMAWLWPCRVTQQKVAQSWSTQLGLVRRYPEHRFASSSTQQYIEKLSSMISKIKFLKGNFTNSTRVAHDANMPSGRRWQGCLCRGSCRIKFTLRARVGPSRKYRVSSSLVCSFSRPELSTSLSLPSFAALCHIWNRPSWRLPFVIRKWAGHWLDQISLRLSYLFCSRRLQLDCKTSRKPKLASRSSHPMYSRIRWAYWRFDGSANVAKVLQAATKPV
jgi:hypothetical protein